MRDLPPSLTTVCHWTLESLFIAPLFGSHLNWPCCKPTSGKLPLKMPQAGLSWGEQARREAVRESRAVNLVHFPNLSLRFLAFQFGIPGACLVCSTLTAVCSGPLAFFVSSRTPAPRVHLPLLFSFTPFPRVSPLSPYLFIPFAAFTPGEGRERGKGSCSRDTLVAPLQRFSKWAPGTPNGSLSGFQVVQDKVREVFCF